MMRNAPGTIGELAKGTFSGLERALFSFEAGARAGDVDAIHDMRVTTRRLRVALSNFAYCFSGEARRELKELFEGLAGALGRVRDLDVMLEALLLLKFELPAPQQPSTRELVRRLRRRRRYHLRRLKEYFEGAEYQRLKTALPRMIAAIEERAASGDGQTIQSQESLGV